MRMTIPVSILRVILLLLLLSSATSYNSVVAPMKKPKQQRALSSSVSRRSILNRFAQVTTGIGASFAISVFHNTAIIHPSQAQAAEAAAAAAAATASADQDIQILQEGYDALSSLLTNWDKATIDCTYADVPRELLERKNKDLLLEKAKTSALFDKSTSVVSCKKNNRIVRDYIGSTGKGPLVNAEKRMLKPMVVEKVDFDLLDDYYSEVENFSQAISKASSLSYAAGMADFDSVNNFAKGADMSSSENDSNLEQAKRAIGEARDAIGNVVKLLTSSEGVE